MTEAASVERPIDLAALRPARIILHLAGLILAFMTIAPLFWMVSMSFKGGDEVFGVNLAPNHPTLDNFLYVFTQVNFLRYLWNSFFVAATVTIIALFFHSMAGYALARLRFPGRDFIFLSMFATFLISQPVIIVPLFILARTLHMLDSYTGLIVPSIFNAFGIFLLRQFYLAVPRELEEAAVIDGAGYFRVYWSIILPLSRPILSALAILFFLANWNSFLWPLTITSDQNLWMVQVAIASFRQQYSASWNYVMAASTIVALPTVVMFVIFQKRIIESIKTSGIK
ncbi:MAG TPA: carbohydrate ABC transporter permease [Roseiarcus sp.]|nr:carbohydrate ABC transporter permease [Roseiarcus sp.]